MEMTSAEGSRHRPRATGGAVVMLALAMVSPGRAADEETEAAAARAAGYGLLMTSGFLVNRAPAKCYCLAVRRVYDEGAVTIEDPPAGAGPAAAATRAPGRPPFRCPRGRLL